MSPAAKLCGFLLLLALIFAGAYAAGAHLGPVTVGTSRPAGQVPGNPGAPGSGSGGSGGSMNMGGP